VFVDVATVPVAYNTVQPVLATVLPSSSSTAQKEGIFSLLSLCMPASAIHMSNRFPNPYCYRFMVVFVRCFSCHVLVLHCNSRSLCMTMQ